MLGAVDTAPKSGHQHVVAFYADDDELTTAVARFVGDGLDGSGTAIVVATPEHQASIRAALNARHALDSTHYVELDAAATLTLIAPGGVPDPAAFMATLDPLLAATAPAGPVRVFGEMVARLWDDGLVAEAIDLEGMWNDLGRRHDFDLLCAYPVAAIDGEGNLGPGKQICDQHSHAMTLGKPHSGDPLSSSVTRTFVPAADALVHVRRFVREALDVWGLAAVRDGAQLIASELGTNAARHAASPFRMTLTRGAAAVRLAVRDASPDQPQLRTPDPADIGGRGLALVAGLADAWGTTIESDGKTVWVEITL